MDRVEIVVRKAVQEDAPLIAQVVAMAIGDQRALEAYCGKNYIELLTKIAACEGTQYSWQQGLIAQIDGTAIGAVVGYDGARLLELRNGTFNILREYLEYLPEIADECEAGEYYLDSVGVLPQFRGKGIGGKLVAALCEKAFSEGHERVGLIVDYDNPKAQSLYLSLGFKRVGRCQFFGHSMWHLQMTKYDKLYHDVEHSVSITEFQRRVYLELLNIPKGRTITYGELARRIGCRSPQAVGQALKRNPFAPDVPCHRVVAADGSLGGYNGERSGEQLERKRQLLKQESE